MNWAWASSLDQIWRSPAFPMWLTLAAAGFFGIVLLITLLRAEKSVANGALTVITLLAVGIAVAATIRGFGPNNRAASGEMPRSAPPINTALPALSCIDDLAGDVVMAGCEKALFGSAESAAAAVSYAAFQLTRLTALSDAANGNMTPELQALRRAVEHDRYGLMAQVLMVRDHCTQTECAAFRLLTDNYQILANMNERAYDGLIARYAPLWNAPPPAMGGPVATLAPTLPTGKPTNADFPSAASTPPVSIMTPEPGTGTTGTTPRSAAAAPAANAPPSASARKPAGPKSVAKPAPIQIAPAAAAPAPGASND